MQKREADQPQARKERLFWQDCVVVLGYCHVGRVLFVVAVIVPIEGREHDFRHINSRDQPRPQR